MTAVCLSFKFGYCKFQNNCEKTHLIDTCETPNCLGYKCNKRHPRECFFFRRFGRCKFGTFCSYAHPISKEVKLCEEVKDLKVEVLSLKDEMKEIKEMLEEIRKEKKEITKNANTEVDTEKTDTNLNESERVVNSTETQDDKSEVTNSVEKVEIYYMETHTDSKEETCSKEDANENKSEETLDEIMKSQDLEDIIRENSGLFCNFCPWGPAKTKKGLITHKAKMHSDLYFKRSKK